MSNATKALRSERDQLREQAGRLRARADQAEERAEVLDSALAVLTGKGRKAKGPIVRVSTGRGPNRRPPISREALADEIHRTLVRWRTTDYSAPALSKITGRAHSSCEQAMKLLVEQGRATNAGVGPKGGPVIRYRALTLKPGEGIRS